MSEEFKVILVGESGVGKTSYMVRFAEGKFKNVHECTLGVDCKKVPMTIENKPIDLKIWDTAGQERFKSIISRFFRSADGAVVMYDTTRKETFDEVPWWIREIRKHTTNIPVILVGNKNDDGSHGEVIDELAQDYADENRLNLYHASARDNVNVTEVFETLASMMLAAKHREPEPDEYSRLYNQDPACDLRFLYLTPKEEKPKDSCCFSRQAKGNLI